MELAVFELLRHTSFVDLCVPTWQPTSKALAQGRGLDGGDDISPPAVARRKKKLKQTLSTRGDFSGPAVEIAAFPIVLTMRLPLTETRTMTTISFPSVGTTLMTTREQWCRRTWLAGLSSRALRSMYIASTLVCRLYVVCVCVLCLRVTAYYKTIQTSHIWRTKRLSERKERSLIDQEN